MLFNLIRHCYECAGKSVTSSWITYYVDDLKAGKNDPETDVVILKAHQYAKLVNKWCGQIDFLFTPIRDIRDTIASRKRRHELTAKSITSGDAKISIEDLVQWGEENITLLNSWDPASFVTRLSPKYEDYYENPPSYVTKLCEQLNLKDVEPHIVLKNST